MQRLFASILFSAAALFASAQQQDITVTDTDAMRASADKHTALVDKTVTLDADQKAKVQEIYMNLERQLDGMNQRFEKGGLTKEEREAEMAPRWASLEMAVDQQLAEVLTPDQAGKWREARK
jgi:Spy/CpxP family protein refolding chaperone